MDSYRFVLLMAISGIFGSPVRITVRTELFPLVQHYFVFVQVVDVSLWHFVQGISNLIGALRWKGHVQQPVPMFWIMLTKNKAAKGEWFKNATCAKPHLALPWRKS
jgi:hypothetical protein